MIKLGFLEKKLEYPRSLLTANHEEGFWFLVLVFLGFFFFFGLVWFVFYNS